ncbi:DNA polymerase zeta catalytic subunit [Amia ocellicauda]|uniref:DNA polymerase zeta catalytic subunit n=1 Tax=Amia ocellicauda TaxID=2972642 RepID=UPI003463A9D7
MFAVRIVTADYYTASPLKDLDVCHSEFRESDVKRVPVVRIFGATPAGQKTCLHVHGIFPYVYVPYDGYGQQPERYLRQVAFSIDRALNVSMGNPSSAVQHVFKVALVSGMPFYGYHAKERQFMKIYLYNPLMVKRVCELLQGGAVMNKSYQPHEAHIPYLLQLFIDYNLYGMNLINLGAVKFRKSRKKDDEGGSLGDGHISSSRATSSLWRSPCTSKVQLSDSSLGAAFVRWEEESIPSSLVLEGVEKQSTCELEADAVAADILNRLEIETQIGRNPGLQAIWQDEKQRRREKNESSQIEPADSQDRGFVTTAESERVFLKRLREILKQNDFSLSLSGSGDEADETDMFPVDLSLHSDILTPEALQCTPANLVEVHKDSQQGYKKIPAIETEVAIVDEEAILSLLESSQTFQSSSQRLLQSPILEGSQDHALMNLLAGLEDDGYQVERPRKSSQQQLSGNSGHHYNSDEEEAGPELERQEAELSLMMSQRWDSDIPDHSAKRRLSGKNSAESSSEEEQDSSEEEMDWSSNNALFASLSIPQLDGAADENSDTSLNDKSSRTHSSLPATDIILGKRNPFPNETVTLEPPSSAKILLECKHPEHRQALSLDTEEPTEKHFLSKSSVILENKADPSVYKMNKESTYTIKYPVPCNLTNKTDIFQMDADKIDVPPVFPYEKKAMSINKPDPDSIPFENGKTQNRKKYTSIKSPEKGHIAILQNHRSFSLCYSDLRNSPAKAELEISQKGSNSPLLRKINPVPSPAVEDVSMAPEEGETEKNSKEGDMGELKIRYEDYQENKTEKTIMTQQEAHYKFFPSVILSNCLNRPSIKCLSKPGGVKLDQEDRRSRLKLSKKKAGVTYQKSRGNVEIQADESKDDAALTPLKTLCSKSVEREELTSSSDPVADTPITVVPTEENRLALPSFTESAEQMASAKSSFLSCSKYTLRAKRKVSYESEDGEPSCGSQHVKSALALRDNLKDDYILSGHEHKYQKRRRISKKDPPIIIKYIIINRFKGQKNMLIKMAKISAEEDKVILTPERLQEYKKLAPLKEFWPRVPESTAVKYPVYPPKAKKSQKKKTKVNSTSKKKICSPPKTRCGKIRRIKRTKPLKKQRTLSTLPPPAPSYNEETNDYSTEYVDVMSKLGYLSERVPSPTDTSPPRCWSPSDPHVEPTAIDQHKDGFLFHEPGSNSSSKESSKESRGARGRSRVGRSRKVASTSPKRKKGKGRTKSSETQSAKKDNPKRKTIGGKQRRRKKNADVPDASQCESSATTKKSRKPRKKKQAEELNESLGTAGSNSSQVLFSEEDHPPSECANGKPRTSQLPVSDKGNGDASSSAGIISTTNIFTLPASEHKSEASTSEVKQVSSDRLGLREVQPSLTQDNSRCANESSQASLSSQTGTTKSLACVNPKSSCPSPIEQGANLPCTPPTNTCKRTSSDASCQSLASQQISDTAAHTEFKVEIPSPLLLSSEDSQRFILPPDGKTPGKSKRRSYKKKEKVEDAGIARFTPIKIKPLTKSKPEDTEGTTKDCPPQPNYKNGERLPPVAEAPSGLAVLKELLQKRQQKILEGTASEHPSCTTQSEKSTSNPVSKPTKAKKAPASTPRKPRNPKPQTPKEKKPRSRKSKNAKLEEPAKPDPPLLDDSPVFLSDPGFESCYSFEDSLSPELPHNYNFDINTIGQTEFCSLYMGSQFVLADKNLPQKFLSDVIQDPVPALALGMESMSDRVPGVGEDLHRGSEWFRTGPISPDLFDKSSSENRDGHPTHLAASLLDSDSGRELAASRIMRTRENADCLVKGQGFSHLQPCSQGFLDVGRDPFLPLPLNSTSFVDLLGSPTGDLMEGNDTLTTTPSSSPRSVSSLSQLRNGNHPLRSTGGAHILKPLMSPPSRDEIMSTLLDLDLSETTYQEPYCSDPSDAPEKRREIGGRVLSLDTRLANQLTEFDGDFSSEGLQFWKTAFCVMTRPGSPTVNGAGSVDCTNGYLDHSPAISNDQKVVVVPCKSAPSRERVQLWLQAKKEFERRQREMIEAGGEGRTKPDKAINQLFGGVTISGDSELKREVVPDESDKTTDMQALREKGLDAFLQVSPVDVLENQRSPGDHKSQPLGAISEQEEEEDDYYRSYSSPDSPVLPPWQQTASPSSSKGELEETEEKGPDLLTLRFLEPDVMLNRSYPFPEKRHDKAHLSPSPLTHIAKAAGKCSPILLHSTPVNKRKKNDRDTEPICSTPILTDSRSPKLRQKRGSADKLRRVILTTQMKNQFAALNVPKKDTSQIEGPSLNNSYGFKISMNNLQDAKALHEVQYLTLMSMELHARTRRDLEPDPEFDPICALFYCITSDARLPDMDKTELTGAIVVDKDYTNCGQGPRRTVPLLVRSGISGLQVTYTADEKELFQEVIDIMRRFDPDILLGYEVQMRSWGYLLQRASALGTDLCQQLSRVPDDSKQNRFSAERDEYGADTMSEINIIGRIILNVWRMMKTEVTLNNYSFENVAFHVLHQRFPLFSPRTLSDWFDHKTHLYRWKMVDHYISHVHGTLQLLEQHDLIGRTSELARLFGIQFYHVLTRGSQYRVESMMLRIAKPMNYIAVTPSTQQRAQMRAPQCIPLVMEPESRFYSNSVVVLDFQSLYPSIVIAYNYCFSTCLGHVENLGVHDEFKFGCTSLRVPPDLLYLLRNDVSVSPNGVAFVKSSVRKGVLPSMLEEILNTRIMVKQSMKAYKHDRAITRMLDARQLGLKLIANVTYGYTSANYSGRMPSVEVGDSIVHKARETLERAIKLVNDTKKWGAHVVYGDTDSMFVLLKGATKEQAFKIGNEIAEAVTATNPKPVKLKFEKVYLPCVLQTKKRYVGYMYESLDQKDPVFDAKGIETVRRDGCPAVAKILERSIKLLFETRDVSQVKQFVQRQCVKILEGKASMQDLTFAKEYRGSNSYRPGACVPALELTRRMLSYDRRSEPRVGERVPYVIVYGMPGLPLIQLVRRPMETLQDPSLRLNTTYYITKQILPPLDRIFALIGVDVFRWYQELPRIQKACSTAGGDEAGRKGTISQYFTTLHCPVCDELTQLGVCSRCRREPQRVAVTLSQDIRLWESQQDQLLKICQNCTGSGERQVQCISLDCPVLYKLSRVSRQLAKAPYLRQLLDQF